jgi:hypothetical protein|tara:strand:- start:13067 stop:13270 length:204 start_codon:yes stop_codon:yes gene_type:complete
MTQLKIEPPLCTNKLLNASESLAVATSLLLFRLDIANKNGDYGKIPETMKIAEKAIERYYDIFKEEE